MKHWQETERVLDALLRLESREGGRGAALARVVQVEGSAYRRPGAKLLVADATTVGGVSGGCLEEDVRILALEAAVSGTPRLRHYDTEDSDGTVWGLGLGCAGKVDVFIQPISERDAVELWGPVRDRLRQSAPFAVGTLIEGPEAGRSVIVDEDDSSDGSASVAGLDSVRALRSVARAALGSRTSEVVTLGDHRAFLEVFLPPPRLLICGAGDDSMPLAAFAAAVGFRVFVADHRDGLLTGERFPEAAALLHGRPEDGVPEIFRGRDIFAVVKVHSFRLDREWTRLLLATETPYIGLLGPRTRTERILSEIGASSADSVFGPVGLDLGADGPEQIALSIVAELMSVRSGREPQARRVPKAAAHA